MIQHLEQLDGEASSARVTALQDLDVAAFKWHPGKDKRQTVSNCSSP